MRGGKKGRRGEERDDSRIKATSLLFPLKLGRHLISIENAFQDPTLYTAPYHIIFLPLCAPVFSSVERDDQSEVLPR